MNFVDQARIYVKAGHGGSGCVSFRRERCVPRGGPDGGDGGDGGTVTLEVVTGLSTLYPFRHRSRFKAADGRPGRGKNQSGRSGADVCIRVPPGTLVRDAKDGRVIEDLTRPGQRWVAARGGRGGQGNARFASATRQAPLYAQPGLSGEERWLVLELKLLADVGLVGTPNAGKSTLLSRLSAARPKIADYPFTTLTPNLGVVGLPEDRSFILADLPGLVEGAHNGVGMGVEFLRHVERTGVLLYVLDVSLGAEAVRRDLDLVRGEVACYSAGLLDKPQAVALNKIDLLSGPDDFQAVAEGLKSLGLKVFPISAVTGAGLLDLTEGLYLMVAAERARAGGERTTRAEEGVWDV